MEQSKKPLFEGPYKKLIIDYLEIRTLRGLSGEYKYQMSALNRFLVEERGHDEVMIAEEDVAAWVNRSDSLKGKQTRFAVIDQFSAYLIAKGYENVYRGDSRQYCNAPAFRARILDDTELAAFFDAADSIERGPRDTTYDHATVFPMLVRLLYGCGLRLSEGTGLKAGDIDFDTGAIRILDSKNGNCRIVYGSDSLIDYIGRYMRTVRANPGDGYLLRGHDGRQYANQSAQKTMRKVCGAAGLEGNGQQPLRLHDLRHNFAVRAMEKMVDEGFDLYASMPYLREYMGHESIEDTEYYIKLVPRGFHRIVDRMETHAPGIIPDLGEW